MIIAGWLFAALALGSVQAAETQAREPEIRGPGLLCLQRISFRLEEGERVVDLGGGLHGAHIEIRRAGRPFSLMENDIMLPPDEPGRKVFQSGEATLYLYRNPTAYAVSAPVDGADRPDRVIAWIGGRALNGGHGDRAIYSRLSFGDTRSLACDFRIGTGFDTLFSN
ncbi:MAG: hypothetical protein KF910_10380 [Brevundimonas sp.]|uniref:hypothetical protein n=1 Tax=Brevundimonas sp. TaxID=1871086 RepID=UPI0025B9C6F5|nr:hypothetical protein [Brevundimonas sp.]MBX3478006.1 hypothetical protein [Brevundimonas sp.]